MILGDGASVDTDLDTLDGLFRRAGVRRPDVLALCDAPNRADRAPRRLTFAEADRAISGVAARLRGLGLMNDSIVAIQLGNTVESIIALLGVLRAGMIAVPLPVLWRQQEMVNALLPLGPKAVITTGRIGAYAHVEIAMHVAAELFPVRHVCSFGSDLPDGVVPLDDVFESAPGELVDASRIEHPAAHVAVITFEVGSQGYAALARNHAELIAGGLAVFLESGLPSDVALLSTIPASTFGGLCATLMPWLLSGGTLHLHHGFDEEAFAAQCAAVDGGALVVPGPVLTPLAETGELEGFWHVLSLWRTPERMATATPWEGAAAVTDIACFGDIAVCAGRRGDDGMPAAIPLGVVHAPRGAGRGPTVLETMRTKAGTLAVRGTMVPKAAFPPGIEGSGSAFFAPEEDGFVRTGFICRPTEDGESVVITGTADGLASVGGYSFRAAEIEARVVKVDAQATLTTVPDALLGQRLAGHGRDRTSAFLQALGFNPLVSGAFRRRKTADAA
ncbi:long-chain fatty acid--CoA ligase [Pseudolabrys taiwanensis]|uniref:Long-chain fatty acid--CoA ligase n=1 Tax=Pseudolabrys taiwanensis TaxID=331696 RepID=A0A345ZSX1_9HYPH|nr:class I adenylate-forming enzyme family protein [Pseudolabrys taiwanensis]AXK80018.1 long-chain fatty acid--CoA ligase [Pseudolabrys taiwanensis]